jgi:exopolysaccharide production protein ExoZ
LIFNLQIVRAFAAIGVVIYHIEFHFRPDLHTDFLGVATFFVLSGFIMCFITRDGADDFLINRLIRIVPLYWLMTAFRTIILGGTAIFHVQFWIDQSDMIVKSLFFLPSDQPPLVGPGWTLNFEIYFYLIFAISLGISRRLAPLLAFAAIEAVMHFDTAMPGSFVAHFYSHHYITFFLDGIVLFYVWRLLKDHIPAGAAFICAFVFIAAYAVQVADPGVWVEWLPILIVGSALFMASAGADLNIRPLVLLGDASYSIYLIHTLVMGSVRRINPEILTLGQTSVVWFLALLSLCILSGVIVHLIIEKPMLRVIRSALAEFRKRYAALKTEVPVI